MGTEQPGLPPELPAGLRAAIERMRARGNRPLLLSEVCAETERPVFGLIGAPLGMKLVSVSHGFDQQGRYANLDLQYESDAGLLVDVKAAGEQAHITSFNLPGHPPDREEIEGQRRRVEAGMAAGTAFMKRTHEIALSQEPERLQEQARQVSVWTFAVPAVKVAVVETAEGRVLVSGALSEADFARILGAVRRIDDQPDELRRQDEEIQAAYHSRGQSATIVMLADDKGDSGTQDKMVDRPRSRGAQE